MIAPSTVLDPACCARAHCRLKSTQRWSLCLVAIQGICFSSASGVGIPVLSGVGAVQHSRYRHTDFRLTHVLIRTGNQ